MSADELELLQGTLDVLVLKTLTWGPRHGYAVARWIRETSDEALTVEDRALYVSLHRLEERGLVESEWGLSENNRKAKFYRLTPAGRAQLREAGFGPPAPRPAGPVQLVQLQKGAFRCPYCGSTDTRLENLFGPTACRSIRYCNGCRQPFEQFKTV